MKIPIRPLDGLLSVYLRSRRLTRIRPYLRGRILDLGCGDGPIISLLSPHNSYTGVDRPRMVRRLKFRYPQHRFFVANLDQGLAVPPESVFDTVVLTAVIEHLENPGILLDQVSPLLVDDGTLIVTTPTPGGDRLHYLGAVIGLASRFATAEHVRVYRKEDLESLLADHGFATKHYETFEFGLNQLIVGSPQHGSRRAGSLQALAAEPLTWM